MTNEINWLINHAETSEGSGEYGSYKIWQFQGNLPRAMVEKLRSYVKANGTGDIDGRYTVCLEYTDTYGKSMVVKFGSTKSTQNNVKFKLTEEWAA
jgi:hypothetical protein